MDTTEIIEENQEEYAEREKELYFIIREFERLTGRTVFRSENLSISYKKPKPLQSEKELLELIEKKLNLGLIEKHEALTILNPNMTEQQARKKIELIDNSSAIVLPGVNVGEKPEEGDEG